MSDNRMFYLSDDQGEFHVTHNVFHSNGPLLGWYFWSHAQETWLVTANLPTGFDRTVASAPHDAVSAILTAHGLDVPEGVLAL